MTMCCASVVYHFSSMTMRTFERVLFTIVAIALVLMFIFEIEKCRKDNINFVIWSALSIFWARQIIKRMIFEHIIKERARK